MPARLPLDLPTQTQRNVLRNRLTTLGVPLAIANALTRSGTTGTSVTRLTIARDLAAWLKDRPRRN